MQKKVSKRSKGPPGLPSAVCDGPFVSVSAVDGERCFSKEVNLGLLLLFLAKGTKKAVRVAVAETTGLTSREPGSEAVGR